MLQGYLAEETLNGDNQFDCATCEGYRDGTRQVELTTAPDCLIVALMRFAYDQKTKTRKKLSTFVPLQPKLEVPLGNGDTAQYELSAVVIHAGAGLGSGKCVLHEHSGWAADFWHLVNAIRVACDLLTAVPLSCCLRRSLFQLHLGPVPWGGVAALQR